MNRDEPVHESAKFGFYALELVLGHTEHIIIFLQEKIYSYRKAQQHESSQKNIGNEKDTTPCLALIGQPLRFG